MYLFSKLLVFCCRCNQEYFCNFRYQVGELIYGSHVTNAYDQLALNSLVDYWLASSSVKKEFELPRGL